MHGSQPDKSKKAAGSNMSDPKKIVPSAPQTHCEPTGRVTGGHNVKGLPQTRN